MKNFQLVSEAVAKMNFTDTTNSYMPTNMDVVGGGGIGLGGGKPIIIIVHCAYYIITDICSNC